MFLQLRLQGLFEKVRRFKPKRIWEKYQQICYIYGRSLDRKEYPEIAKMIYQADMEMTPGLFLSLLTMSALLCSTLAFFVFWLPLRHGIMSGNGGRQPLPGRITHVECDIAPLSPTRGQSYSRPSSVS